MCCVCLDTSATHPEGIKIALERYGIAPDK